MTVRVRRRSIVSIVVFLGVAALVVGGWQYEARRAGHESLSNTVAVSVTNGADRGAGTLREALFVVATAQGPARISLDVPRITLQTPLPPIVNAHGVRIVVRQGGSEIDAHGLSGGPVLDVAAANVSLDGLTISHCANDAILVRAVHFSLENSTFSSCDVGVDVAENAQELLLENNHFVNGRIGLRFSASSPDTTVAANQFTGEQQAGVWAVRGATDLGSGTISVRENRFDNDHDGIVAGNINVLIEQNEVSGAQAAAIDLVGAGAIVRGNRVSGGAAMGILVEGVPAAVIEQNDLNGLGGYGIMVRGSGNALLQGNRVSECAYGMAFVLGNTRSPSTAVDNIIIEPRYDGIDVVGDAPILRGNHVVQPHAFALRVEDFNGPDGRTVQSAPFLDHNSFGPPSEIYVARRPGRS
ncbi:MAG TPA: right-handed parallel beta-helix repeat-containing protein [Steroidobacteraceae bacterium]|nr:right-handed parallel beta-helix repeat-containing protein [Steroidobacteraceae bacterium]